MRNPAIYHPHSYPCWTPGGWKTLKQLKPGDPIYSISPESLIAIVPIMAIHHNFYSDTIYQHKGDVLNFKATAPMVIKGINDLPSKKKIFPVLTFASTDLNTEKCTFDPCQVLATKWDPLPCWRPITEYNNWITMEPDSNCMVFVSGEVPHGVYTKFH